MRTPQELEPVRIAAIAAGVCYFIPVAALLYHRQFWLAATLYAAGFAISLSCGHRNDNSPPEIKDAAIYFFCSLIIVTDIFMAGISEYERRSKPRFFAAIFAQTLVWCKYAAIAWCALRQW